MWGGVSKKKLEPIFITQTKCLRVIFCDREAYQDKFKTCARCRPYEKRILGSEFYRKESSKPLFKERSLLTVHNLYKYHCLIEMFKVIKLRLSDDVPPAPYVKNYAYQCQFMTYLVVQGGEMII